MIGEDFLTLTPAYGRDYRSKALAKQDFLAGRDWKLQPEDKYCSKRDFAVGTKVILRYNRLKDACVVEVK